MRFVLTGVAKVEGLHILREDLIAAAEASGHHVMSKVGWLADVLVTDSNLKTQKRRDALDYNMKIISTEKFIEKYLGGTIELTKTLEGMI